MCLISRSNILCLTRRTITRGPFYWRGLILTPTWISNFIHYICGVKLFIHSQISKIQLEFGNKHVISSPTLLGIWLLIHAGIWLMYMCKQRGACYFLRCSNIWILMIKCQLTSIGNYTHYKVLNQITSPCQTSTVQPLKFGKVTVISPHTFVGMLLSIIAGIRLIHIRKKNQFFLLLYLHCFKMLI